MPEHIHYEEEDIFNPETKHEETDVPVRPLFIFMIIFVVSAVLIHLFILAMYKGLVNLERGRAESPQTRVARPQSELLPQQPLLQPFPRKATTGEVLPPQRNTPVTDMDDMLRAQNEVLNSYGYVDREKGIVRIPIALAKELVAQRGLTQAGATATPAVPAPAAPRAPSQFSEPVQRPAATPESNAASAAAQSGSPRSQ